MIHLVNQITVFTRNTRVLGYKTGTPSNIFQKLVNKNTIKLKNKGSIWNFSQRIGPFTNVFLETHPISCPWILNQ